MSTALVGSTRAAGVGLILSRDEHQAAEWQSGNIEVGRRRVRFVAVGLCPMPVGADVTIDGYVKEHPEYGEQLHIEVCKSVALPKTLEGVALFLGGGNIPAIGQARAAQIVQRLGLTALQQIDARPEILGEIVPDLHGQRMVEGWRAWQHRWAEDRATADLSTRLLSNGIGTADTRRIVNHFRSADVVDCVLGRHPYRLLDIPGVGWRKADEIARKLGVAPGDPRRITAAAAYVLAERQREGHSCYPTNLLMRDVRALTQVPKAEPMSAEDEGVLVVESDRAYLPEALEAEYAITHRLARHLHVQHPITAQMDTVIAEECAKGGLSAEQAYAVREAFARGVSVLSGGPGTGKTTTTRVIVAVAKRLALTYVVIAPTGKAASRAAQVTGGVAGTIHRVVRTPPGQHAAKPVTADLLIIDEGSMVSAEIMAWLLANLLPTTRLLVLGDADQLPSIDHGAVLRDLMASGRVPVTRLGRTYRQRAQSGIITNAALVLQAGTLVPSTDFRIDDITLAPSPDVDKREHACAISRLTTAIRTLASAGVDVATDVQVLTPRKQGALGVRNLNRHLQHVFNPSGEVGPKIGAGYVVSVGDRVTQMRNDYTLGQTGVFNGEQGIVTNVAGDSVTVRFDQGEVMVKNVQLYNLQLAWASTIHRSQGSEWPHVLSVFHRSHMARRGGAEHELFVRAELLYTALTRAKTSHTLVSDQRALDAVRRSARHPAPRYTGLADRLRAHLG